MEMTEIRKQSLGVLEQVNDTIIELATRAQEILGYNALQKHTGAINTAIELTPLQQTLRDLDIEIMLPGDVIAYKKERQVEQTKINLENWLKIFAATENPARYDCYNGPAWTQEKISEYRQPVPQFVLAKAVQIKERLPECEVWIESLSDHPDPFLAVGIPGTQTYSSPKEYYYVEVWAEPVFEGRLR